MSVYAVARVKQLMDCLVNQAVAPLVAESEAAERVESWLADNASRESYRRELAFMVLRGLLKDDNATMRYAGNIKPHEWQSILDEVAKLRTEGKLPALAYPPAENWVEPYMYASTFLLHQYSHGGVRPEGKVFFDCGACCGETAIWAIEQGASKVYAFEPNPAAFSYLEKNAATFGEGRIVSVPVGLGAQKGQLALCEDVSNIGGTRLAEGIAGVPTVPVVTLDDWCQENSVQPGFIKMDLEGAEVDTIRGAQRTISELRPQLAITLYHRLSDMWNIPILLKQLMPDYRFWCRKNASCAEFVLYASL